MRIDDPVHCISTHGITGLWGVVVVGLVVEKHPLMSKNSGVFKGGTWKILGIQVLAAVSIALWTSITTFVQLYIIDKAIGLRMPREKEIDGADKWEHGIVITDIDRNISCLTSERRIDAVPNGNRQKRKGIHTQQGVNTEQGEELVIEDI